MKRHRESRHGRVNTCEQMRALITIETKNKRKMNKFYHKRLNMWCSYSMWLCFLWRILAFSTLCATECIPAMSRDKKVMPQKHQLILCFTFSFPVMLRVFGMQTYSNPCIMFLLYRLPTMLATVPTGVSDTDVCLRVLKAASKRSIGPPWSCPYHLIL